MPLPLYPLVVGTLLSGVWATGRADIDRVPELIERLTTDPSYKVRVSSALVLGKLGDKRAVPALCKILSSDPHYAVRATAAQALGRIADPKALPALEKALADPHTFVQNQARLALEAMKRGGQRPKETSQKVIVRKGNERFYVGVSGVGDKSKKASPDMLKRLREIMTRQLEESPDITLSAEALRNGRKLKAFMLEGSITELRKTTTRNHVEISCEVSYVVGTYPSRSIIMMTTGGATIQTPKTQFRVGQERELSLSALEEAVKGAHQNLLAFLKKQK